MGLSSLARAVYARQRVRLGTAQRIGEEPVGPYAECFPGERPHLEIGRRSVELFERRDGFLLACCAASGVTPPYHQSVALLDQQSITTLRAGLCD